MADRTKGRRTGKLWEYTMDIYHTPYYAAGYLFAQAKPRMGAICHFEWSDDSLMAESVAEIRSHWDGLFMFGFDLNVINITKDAIWSRQAVVSDGAAPASMDPRWFVKPGDPLPESITFPTPRLPREEQQEQFVRDLEIDRRSTIRPTCTARRLRPGRASRSTPGDARPAWYRTARGLAQARDA